MRKIDKLNLSQLKTDIVKVTVKRMKKQVTGWGKIFANHMFDKGLVLRIYKEISKVNNKKTTNQFSKKQKISTDTSSKKTY